MKTVVHFGLMFAIAAGSGYADNLLILAADIPSYEAAAQNALVATSKFDNVCLLDVQGSTPTLTDPMSTCPSPVIYNDVLVWVNLAAWDSVALGNALADFYDKGGKHITIATFALATGTLDGRIKTLPYVALADTGNFANPSGILVPVPTVSSDPVFANVNLTTLTYYHNRGFVNASVATSATLLATDGSGINMIARSGNGVVNINLYPGLGAGAGGVDNGGDFYTLVANTFTSPGPPPLPSCTGTNLTAAGGFGQIQLNWTLASADHYNIYRGAATGGPYSYIGVSNAITPTYVDRTVAGSTTYYYVMREASAANTETCQSNEAKGTDAVDTTPPTTTISASPGANASGWNNSDVTITLKASDNAGGSGIQSINYTLTGAQTGSYTVTGSLTTFSITAEGITYISYYSVDAAGNKEVAKTLMIQLDKTPPVATATANPGPNSTGWNNTNVTVSFSGSDRGSGVASCTGPITLNQNGAGQVAQGTCTDNAGNVSAPASLTVNIDKTNPVISGVPAPGTCVVWAPDHRMVQVATLTVTGADAFNVTGTSNQPPDPGQTDIVISGSGTGPRTIQLRSERWGDGASRIYTLTATASTWAGQSTVQTFTCTVPHDREDEKGKDNKGVGRQHDGAAE